ncbi:RNA polymerase sigma factor [Ornithinibacillus halotolerans]|uniref:RNA polymerase sigma factor YlaC n=1 Tax=Ornithinibacillus halotolerans TaxID=1274357 RepID=A0A916SAK8_9BACI|nr:RNA polymerase sigma factor [Ornithinibacillus halotolerans]GGA89776.1 RNA polymerase sigma factor YlaC [Ornithinibacillus halotolerans]
MDLEKQIKELYEQHHHEIFSYIFIMIGDWQQARDLMQDTFVKAFMNHDRFRGDASPKTWLYQIARNVSIDYLRKKKPVAYYLDYYSPILSKQPTPDEVLQKKENVEYLYLALFKLKKGYRDVIVLRKVNEFSIKETASILNWKESRVKTMLHRGLEALRKELVKEGYTNETV